jgi:octanoyl-[GcvH]:protein N-octanoyltransferase
MLKEAFSSSAIYLLDRTDPSTSGRVIDSFALDETLCQEIGSRDETSYVHMWVHKPSIVLGSSDTKLSKVQDGIDRYRKLGYDICVRPSGGAAVVLDEGVLNVSFILPINESANHFNYGYDLMVQFIRHVLDPFQVKLDTGEIMGSYCPGAYDVSVGGQKFCGIAQRRRTSGYAVQAFIMLSGSGKERSQLIKQFYDDSGTVGDTYPLIDVTTVSSLQEILGQAITLEWFKERVYSCLKDFSPAKVMLSNQWLPRDVEAYQRNRERVIERTREVMDKG